MSPSPLVGVDNQNESYGQFLNLKLDAGSHVIPLKQCDDGEVIWASSPENLSFGFPTKQDSNQSSQLHGLARKLKFCS